ncbi:AraC family transcriptional regulator [Paenibacillus albidus]|uniref:AraC family transcriptional regulator n=1 Tax=Paenibacillus albidus TaxID=2041023 RepID=UPI0020365CE3|nr:AraC family transcriptional regulator [Paenibacillus albidus]
MDKEMENLEWLMRMKNAMDYIESRLEEPLNMDEIAKVAYSSPFHFQRMFLLLTGVAVAEYIRKRRLSLAAQELCLSNVKVLDLALKYGYDSPESFSKAFRKLHGVSPSAARDKGVPLKAFPRLSFHLSLKGDKEMEYRIVQKDSFTIVGKSVRVTTKDGENIREIPKFWDRVNTDGTADQLIQIGGDKDILGVCLDMDHAGEQFSYWVAVEAQPDANTQEYETAVIPAADWAVFTSVGPMPDAIQGLWQRIFQEWFPETDYEHAGGPELELYSLGDIHADDYRSEVWIPIKKKA